MAEPDLQAALDGVDVEPEVFALRPDYRVLLLSVEGLEGGPTDADADAALRAAEESACEALADGPPEELPHVAAWREAYRAFGAKPQRTRNSLEALLRRAASGLPRIDRLTDTYNAISVLHLLPLGGEDLARFDGAPRLVRAHGGEPFDTFADGAPAIGHPDPGEVIWRDDAGVTCRRWNWRQATRTRLGERTARALFVLDALEPLDDAAVSAAGDDLHSRLGPRVRTATRLIAGPGDPGASGGSRC